MLYPARWKRITVDQSKVLKNRLFRFLGGHPVYGVQKISANHFKIFIDYTIVFTYLKIRCYKNSSSNIRKYDGVLPHLLVKFFVGVKVWRKGCVPICFILVELDERVYHVTEDDVEHRPAASMGHGGQRTEQHEAIVCTLRIAELYEANKDKYAR